MRVTEIPGLTAGQKQVSAINFGTYREDGPPFEDDRPSHTIGLEGELERRAAMSGILASAHEHPDLPLLLVSGIVLAELQMRDAVILSPKRKPDEALLAGMHWTAHYTDRLGLLTLSAIAKRSSLAAGFAEFIGGEHEFSSSLELLRKEVAVIEQAGVFDETGPDHVHTIGMPEPRVIPHLTPPSGGFHL